MLAMVPAGGLGTSGTGTEARLFLAKAAEAVMAILVRCPHCARGFTVRDELGGRRVRCQCGEIIKVPARTALLRLLDDELSINLDPSSCDTPDEWLKIAGAPSDVAEQMNKKLGRNLTGNANFMMGLTGAVALLMFVIGIVAFWFAGS